ncbi:MAG: cytochrome c-type biogenesis protein CcmH [Proteobacteria bacterium]|nr:cytochrome c-type biogenesis protein CcmH [Pseudomonadota bacterium]
MKRFEFYLVLLLIFSVTGTVYGKALSPELEVVAKKIETELIAPCCMVQQVSVHSSPIANEMKVDIRKMLAVGKTRQEILDHYIEKYGLEILSSPPQTGFNRLSVWIPVISLLFGFVVIAVIIKIWVGSRPKYLKGASAAGPADDDIDEETSKRIERELKEID